MDLLFVNQNHNHSATLLRAKYKILFLQNGNIIRNYNLKTLFTFLNLLVLVNTIRPLQSHG